MGGAVSAADCWAFSYPFYAYVIKIKREYDFILLDISKNFLLCRMRFKTRKETLEKFISNDISSLGESFFIAIPSVSTTLNTLNPDAMGEESDPPHGGRSANKQKPGI